MEACPHRIRLIALQNLRHLENDCYRARLCDVTTRPTPAQDHSLVIFWMLRRVFSSPWKVIFTRLVELFSVAKYLGKWVGGHRQEITRR